MISVKIDVVFLVYMRFLLVIKWYKRFLVELRGWIKNGLRMYFGIVKIVIMIFVIVKLRKRKLRVE